MSVPSENFRQNDLRFLQEQNRKAITALAKIEAERDDAVRVANEYETQFRLLETNNENLISQFLAVESKNRSAQLELQQIDQSIRSTADNNKTLRDKIAIEETHINRANEQSRHLDAEDQRLTRICSELSSLRRVTDEQLHALNHDKNKAGLELERCLAEREQLHLSIANLKAHTKSELEQIEEALRTEKRRNTELLMLYRGNEISEKKLTADVLALKDRVSEESADQTRLESILRGSSIEHDNMTRRISELASQLANKEEMNSTVKEAISDQTAQVQKARQAFHETSKLLKDGASNVYSLSEQLRIVQLHRKRRIEESAERKKLIDDIEGDATSVISRCAAESEEHVKAVYNTKKAEQLIGLLRKKFRQLEETSALAQKSFEKVERDYHEVREKGEAISTQNTYLALRVESVEDDESLLKHELKRVENGIAEVTSQLNLVTGKVATQNQFLSTLEADCAKIRADLEYIKREDLLDVSGRVKPLLIESTSDPSGLVEKLHINEFLIQAQSSPKESVTLLIEKIAQLLELVHNAQSQAEQYLADLTRSNAFVTQLRDKNKNATEDVNSADGFISMALTTFMRNSLLKASGPSNLYLGNLGYTAEHVLELLNLIKSVNPSSLVRVERLSLKSNKCDDLAIEHILQMMKYCQNLREIDLSGNRLSFTGVNIIAAALSQIDGVTGVVRDEKKIVASSGNQLRYVVHVEGQIN